MFVRNVVLLTKFSAQLATQYVLQFDDDACVLLNTHLDVFGVVRRHQQFMFDDAVLLVVNDAAVVPMVAD